MTWISSSPIHFLLLTFITYHMQWFMKHLSENKKANSH